MNSPWLPVLAPTFMIGLAALIVAMLNFLNSNRKADKEEIAELKSENAQLKHEVQSHYEEIDALKRDNFRYMTELYEKDHRKK